MNSTAGGEPAGDAPRVRPPSPDLTGQGDGPRTCPRCARPNGPGESHCHYCGTSLAGAPYQPIEVTVMDIWPRMGAWTIDAMVIGIPSVFITFLLPETAALAAWFDDRAAWAHLLDLLFIQTLGLFVYKTFFTAIWAATPGKMLLGMRVASVDDYGSFGAGRVVVREALFVFFLGFPLLNIVWAGLVGSHLEHRGWHDRLAGSVVVSTN